MPLALIAFLVFIVTTGGIVGVYLLFMERSETALKKTVGDQATGR
jgi:hypothetical protein